ncbi:retrovirus-related Pol polyprotein from transposon 412 [Nephila pilipes]|uniref:Retrovirus-related Pol polyprotein from transposon 412 n=1 Tax=Nephila pilipes TaxID=299642 RepID=A0A8X6P5X8_NEPPI|nr:retrovirus-related Pol polyprotein from transposon 412 [Nephila pilipes]
MIYGVPIRLPDEFLCSFKQNADPTTFVGIIRESMQRLSPPTTRHHGQNMAFLSKDLTTCNYIFLWTDSMKKGLQLLYEGPCKIVKCTQKVFLILRHEEVSESVDWQKPAYLPRELVDIPAGVPRKEKVSSL